MHKKFWLLESVGVVFVVAGSCFMRRLYALSGYGLSGVLFGSVNNSPWEAAKTLFLPYLVWSLLELLCLGGGMRRLAVAKAAALAVLLGVYLGLRFCSGADLVCIAVAVAAATFASAAIRRSSLPVETVFPVALCVLFLLLAFYFCFTPFPPHNPLFADPVSGQYGIPPLGYDFGADVLG